MDFRRAVMRDLPDLMRIYADARDYLLACGVNQWQDGYPQWHVVRQDILARAAYVAAQDDIVLGALAVFFGEEPDYRRIVRGSWIGGGEYAAVHRFAVTAAQRGRGAASFMMREAENIARMAGAVSVRIDTHEFNRTMRRFLEKSGFRYCGEIFLADGQGRVAYEKLLQA